MVREKMIDLENFQIITKNSEIRNINKLEILYLELNEDDYILRQLDQIDKNKNNLKQLYLYFNTNNDKLLFKICDIIGS